MKNLRKIVILPDPELMFSDSSHNHASSGFFHKWTTKKQPIPEDENSLQDVDFALVELLTGEMKYVRPELITFVIE